MESFTDFLLQKPLYSRIRKEALRQRCFDTPFCNRAEWGYFYPKKLRRDFDATFLMECFHMEREHPDR